MTVIDLIRVLKQFNRSKEIARVDVVFKQGIMDDGPQEFTFSETKPGSRP